MYNYIYVIISYVPYYMYNIYIYIYMKIAKICISYADVFEESVNHILRSERQGIPRCRRWLMVLRLRRSPQNVGRSMCLMRFQMFRKTTSLSLVEFSCCMEDHGSAEFCLHYWMIDNFDTFKTLHETCSYHMKASFLRAFTWLKLRKLKCPKSNMV